MWNVKNKLVGTKNRLVAIRVGIGGCGSSGEMDEGDQSYKLPIVRQTSSGDIMYNMVTIVSNTVLYI